jgi:integrase/recombinase XerD
MKRIKRKITAIDFLSQIEKFLIYCRAKGLSEETVAWYDRRLKGFANHVGIKNPLDIDSDTIRKFILDKQGEVSTDTLNGYLRVLRAFFNYQVREGELSASPMGGVSLVKGKKVVIAAFSQEQLQRLFRMPDKSTFKGYRDYLMMLVLLDTGLRVSELIRLKVSDVDKETGAVKVLGKGNKERLVYLGPKVLKELKQYLFECLNQSDAGWPLFPNQWGRNLSLRTFEDSLAEYGKLAGIKGVRVSPHTFRHSFREAIST